MDHLPRNAKQLLALACTAEEPSALARERVRHAVGLVIAAGITGQAATAGAQSTATLKAPFLATLPGKLTLVVGAAILIGAGVLVVSRAEQPAPRASTKALAGTPPISQSPSSPAPAVVAPPAPLTPLSEATPEPAVARRAKAVVAPAADDGLSAEMAILHAASTALEGGQLEQARTLLARHRADFQRGQLRQERSGLEALVRCLGNEPGAEKNARAYLRSTPQGVLSARVANACLPRSGR